MRFINEILYDKKINGNDCNEEESAYIKQWLLNTIIDHEDGSQQVIEDIQLLFPLEYGEYLDMAEHPQQTVKEDSVVSLEDAALELMAKELEAAGIRKYTCMNLCGYSQVERSIANGILDLQKEQYKELLSSYRELLELLKWIESDVSIIDTKAYNKVREAIVNSDNVLNNLK